MSNENKYKNLLEEIIQSNDAIRFTAICLNFGTITEKVQRDGITLLLNEKDTEKLVGIGINKTNAIAIIITGFMNF